MAAGVAHRVADVVVHGLERRADVPVDRIVDPQLVAVGKERIERALDAVAVPPA